MLGEAWDGLHVRGAALAVPSAAGCRVGEDACLARWSHAVKRRQQGHLCVSVPPARGGCRLIPAMLGHLCCPCLMESSPGRWLTSPSLQHCSVLLRVSQGGGSSVLWSLPHGPASTDPWRTVFPWHGTSRDCTVPTWPPVKPQRQHRAEQGVGSQGCLGSCWKVPLCSAGQAASVGVLFPGHAVEAGGSPLSACQVRFMLPAQAAVRTSRDPHVQLADPAHCGGEELLASCARLRLTKLLCANGKTQTPPVSPWQAAGMLLGW